MSDADADDLAAGNDEESDRGRAPPAVPAFGVAPYGGRVGRSRAGAAILKAEEVTVAIELEERSFDNSSPVARYWLAHCEGFRVAGPIKGTVEQVIGAADPHTPQSLVVRRAWRRRTIPVAAIGTVIPAAHLIVTDRGLGLAPGRAPARSPFSSSRQAATLAAAAAGSRMVARFAAGLALELALLVAAALVTLARVIVMLAIGSAHRAAVAATRLLSGLNVRRDAAASKHRRRSAPLVQHTSAHEPRTLSRAAVLGLERRADRGRLYGH